MKTGIFGGAFDPIHKGHIYMAQKAMEEYALDRILIVPSVTRRTKLRMQ